jgi:hypothetical protein
MLFRRKRFSDGPPYAQTAQGNNVTPAFRFGFVFSTFGVLLMGNGFKFTKVLPNDIDVVRAGERQCCCANAICGSAWIFEVGQSGFSQQNGPALRGFPYAHPARVFPLGQHRASCTVSARFGALSSCRAVM